MSFTIQIWKTVDHSPTVALLIGDLIQTLTLLIGILTVVLGVRFLPRRPIEEGIRRGTRVGLGGTKHLSTLALKKTTENSASNRARRSPTANAAKAYSLSKIKLTFNRS